MRMGMKRKRLRCIIILPAILAALYFTAVRLEPAFLTLTHEAANNMINSMINEKVAEVFAEYSSDAFYTETDDTFISNVSAINTLKSDIVSGLYEELSEDGGTVIKIPLGSASGLYLLNGIGPSVPIKISPAEMITADFENSFESAGINFVKHTMYMTVSVTVNYRGFVLNEQETITTRIPVIENVTSGSVPEYYGGAGFIGSSVQ